MKYQLLRNCAHGSKIYTLRVEEPVQEYYIKSSSVVEGLKNINQEYNGWCWYYKNNNSLEKNPANFLVLKKNYAKLKISAFKGEKISIRNGIRKNYNYLLKVVNHYQEIWNSNSNNKVSMHGDLSLDNILFKNDRAFFIDWEHFNIDCTFWGFDIFYLLYETLWFNWRNIKKFRNDEILFISKLIKVLYSNLHLNHKNYTLSFLLKFIRENSQLWADQLLNNSNKLPVLNFEYSDVIYVDKLMTKYMEG